VTNYLIGTEEFYLTKFMAEVAAVLLPYLVFEK